jgi:hypothetical protein
VLHEFNVGLWASGRRRVLMPKKRLVTRDSVVHGALNNILISMPTHRSLLAVQRDGVASPVASSLFTDKVL